MRSDRLVALALAAAALLLPATNVSAHRFDELLQAARIGIADHVALELDLTPGVSMSESMVAEIDRDRDGRLSAAEQRAFVDQVLRAIEMTADQRALTLSPTSFSFPSIDALRKGEAPIAIRAGAALAHSTGAHAIFLRNSFRKEASVYLANALVPQTDRVAVNAQKRDGPQSELTIEYTVTPEAANRPSPWVATALLIAGVAFVLKSAAKI